VLFCLSYLLFAASQHRMAEIAQTKLISMRDHVATKHIVKPSIGNIFLHRSVYLHNGVYYVDAIHVFPGLSTKIYAGGEVEALNTKEVFPQLKENTRQAKDVSRFNKFSDGYLCQHPELDEVIGDIRFAMFPTSVSPLWGIKIDPDNPDQSPELVKYRQIEQGDLDRFFRMLFRRSNSSKTHGSIEK
jgi:inner membrane protein